MLSQSLRFIDLVADVYSDKFKCGGLIGDTEPIANFWFYNSRWPVPGVDKNKAKLMSDIS